ncbi:hypothetical protein Tco_1362962 [Tanacetum coccineum]
MESLNSNFQERKSGSFKIQREVSNGNVWALFDQDNQTFTESLVLMKQFQTFINFRYSFDDFDGAMIHKSFLEYTRTEIQQFRDTLIQHMKSVKKSIDERAQHKRENNRRVNDRVMQSKEGNVDSSTTLDAGLVVTESNETESERLFKQLIRERYTC